jgi:hypothetical protein
LFIEKQVSELQLRREREREREREGERERERERGASLGEDFLYLFELSLGIVLAIYNNAILLGFLPHEGFLG